MVVQRDEYSDVIFADICRLLRYEVLRHLTYCCWTKDEFPQALLATFLRSSKMAAALRCRPPKTSSGWPRIPRRPAVMRSLGFGRGPSRGMYASVYGGHTGLTGKQSSRQLLRKMLAYVTDI